MRILGISAFYHDSAAALIEDGRIVAAAQEERFSRKKHDSRFPINALRYCLSESGGGLAGVAVGLAAAAGAAALGPWELVVSWPAAGLGVACSTILGFAVGVIPAARAARLEPIAALRAE